MAVTCWMHNNHVRALCTSEKKSGKVNPLRAKMAEHPELLITVCSNIRPPSLQGMIFRTPHEIRVVLNSTNVAK